jgi:DNA ligase-1
MFVSPMLLHQIDEPFNDTNYITELKFDGMRLILSHFDSTKLYTRHHNEVTTIFPELQNLSLPSGTVLDGEVIVSDEEGKADFEALMQRFHSNKPINQILFCVFDILYYKNKSVMHLPLTERKEILNELIPSNTKNILTIPYIKGNATQYFNAIQNNDLEGCVLKAANSSYIPNTRSKQWIKVINYRYTDVFISGFMKDKFGLLLSFENGKSAGVMEFMPPKERSAFFKIAKQIITFEDEKLVYIDKLIKCKVKYRNLTNSGKLRIPVFQEFILNYLK